MNYLTGSNGGPAQDPKYILDLYLQLGEIKKPVKIAIAIAEDDMQHGQYKNAHQLLFTTYKRLLDNGHRSTLKLHMRLLILHTYILVRKLISLKEHERAARLLTRVCENISQFPQHGSIILTSAVIESSKA